MATAKPSDVYVRQGSGDNPPAVAEEVNLGDTSTPDGVKRKTDDGNASPSKSKRQKFRENSSSDSESDSDQDTDSDGESESSSSDEDTASVLADKPPNSIPDNNATGPGVNSSNESGYSRFDIEETDSVRVVLPDDMKEYINRKFTKFIPDKVLKEKILDFFPVPENVNLLSPSVDGYVPDIFEAAKRSYGRKK